MWDYREGTDLWSFDLGVTCQTFLSSFYSCAFNHLWVERQFSEASPSHEVDVSYVQRLPPSQCISQKPLLAVLTLNRFSDRVSRSTKHTLGKQTVCASGGNKELDSSWCGGSAQWATRLRMVSFFLLPEFKSQQHIGRRLWCESLSKNSQATEGEGKGRSLGVNRTAGFWLQGSEGCDSISHQPQRPRLPSTRTDQARKYPNPRGWGWKKEESEEVMLQAWGRDMGPAGSANKEKVGTESRWHSSGDLCTVTLPWRLLASSLSLQEDPALH